MSVRPSTTDEFTPRRAAFPAPRSPEVAPLDRVSHAEEGRIGAVDARSKRIV